METWRIIDDRNLRGISDHLGNPIASIYTIREGWQRRLRLMRAAPELAKAVERLLQGDLNARRDAISLLASIDQPDGPGPQQASADENRG